MLLRICSAQAPSRVSVNDQPSRPVAVRDADGGEFALLHDPVAEDDRRRQLALDGGDADILDGRLNWAFQSSADARARTSRARKVAWSTD